MSGAQITEIAPTHQAFEVAREYFLGWLRVFVQRDGQHHSGNSMTDGRLTQFAMRRRAGVHFLKLPI
ncbi:hypothetical protein OR60_11950 [Xanthomonas vesicatoria]|uniref:Uncharacterized protein n=1 Tax=Xanthomonas vesicatoria TaxID=56460 RepID=A0AAJ0IWT9_9XANT|nr:hypothetical protein BI313_14360 [Xanthomonas vesicatoria]KHM92753.1 hypothetical protein OR61_15955 [Xanthomonas vesicatoria]KHM94111.1 hypothetical protein OR60_11950 [Xanthomonas vesicatoria]